MGIMRPDPTDFFGQAILLQCAIRDFRDELTIDLCANRPRLVVMAVADLQQKADEIVASMRAKMEELRKADNMAITTEIE